MGHKCLNTMKAERRKKEQKEGSRLQLGRSGGTCLFFFSPSSQNSCHSEGRAWVGWWLHFLLRSRCSALIIWSCAHQAARPFRSRLLFFRPLTWIASNVLQTCKKKKGGEHLRSFTICCASVRAAEGLPSSLTCHSSLLHNVLPWCFFFPTLLFFVFVSLSRNAVLSIIT